MNATLRYRDFFHGVFTWISGLSDAGNHGTLDEIHRFWAADGRIITCGQVKAAGIEELREHFGIYPRQYEEVEIREPFHTYLEAGDEVVIEYDILIRGRRHEGAADEGDTGRREFRVIAIFSVTDGRISEMRQIPGVRAGDA
ncbi:nuclear transport factor 2 family protein [Streptomyces sp. NBC_00343]|uniref:nuclear transport factor 2 family protein n=1 Tax=Streptomyces sp. NBC_00343 TaxID=2975719 RepID=UPI002E2A2139|nr:nuclear transport factor 2 family protein [Streptomyces sp. NBC_00343]